MNPLGAFSSIVPYTLSALEPVLSKETVQYHFIQHHWRCHERAAAMVRGTELESLSLPSLVCFTGTQPGYRQLFTLAAEAWHHDLYWTSLRPDGGGELWGPVAAGIRRSFGSFEVFLRCMKTAAGAVIGSRWLWLTWRAGGLEIMTTGKAESPITSGYVPLLGIDLWEHAYYLDYYNARAAYVSGCLKHLIDWERANERLLATEATSRNGTQALAWLTCGIPNLFRTSRRRPAPQAAS
jgi:superoxide dismutase, Fe-Mn family